MSPSSVCVWQTLVTDYHLPCKILGKKEEILLLATARMQQWALLLSSNQYKIQHVPGKQNNYYCAGCMFHLLNPLEESDSTEKVHLVVMTKQLPVLALQIAKASEKDKELATVITAVQHGHLLMVISHALTPFYSKRNDLTVVDGCLV